MGLDYSGSIYLPNFNFWARPVTIYPIKSQPGVPSYNARGIFSTQPIDIITTDASDIPDQRTILDIREIEFAVIPQQQDQVLIPDDPVGMPAAGLFEVNDAFPNGGGETTLELRRIIPARP